MGNGFADAGKCARPDFLFFFFKNSYLGACKGYIFVDGNW